MTHGIRFLQEVRRLGGVAIALHQPQEARARLYEALAGSRELGNQYEIAECLYFVAMLAAEVTAYERAANLSGAADALRESIVTPRGYAEREHYDKVLAKCREALGEAANAAAIAAGRALPSDQASDAALAWLAAR